MSLPLDTVSILLDTSYEHTSGYNEHTTGYHEDASEYYEHASRSVRHIPLLCSECIFGSPG